MLDNAKVSLIYSCSKQVVISMPKSGSIFYKTQKSYPKIKNTFSK